MNTNKILKLAAKLHTNAKNSILKHNGITYSIEFDTYMGTYTVYNLNKCIVQSGYNTRKISIAKKWFIEYLNAQ